MQLDISFLGRTLHDRAAFLSHTAGVVVIVVDSARNYPDSNATTAQHGWSWGSTLTQRPCLTLDFSAQQFNGLA